MTECAPPIRSGSRRRHRAAGLALLLIWLPTLPGCSTTGYYFQSVQGHLQVLSARRPIAEAIADPRESQIRRAQLRRVQEMRRFASAELALPDNASYTSYSDIRRRYVLHNVFATPELALEPVRSCFVFVGCLDYRGYFREHLARRRAAQLSAQGYDVYVGGVAAYSTLGWFDDPVLNTMLDWNEPQLAKFLFHELAHQQLYVKNDTAFNEAFAETVAEIGLDRWLQRAVLRTRAEAFRAEELREQRFVELILTMRHELAINYATADSDVAKRRRKGAIFAHFRVQYQTLRKDWGDYRGYDAWVENGLNNAKVSAVVTYHDRIPAFRRLLELARGELHTFYAFAAELGSRSTTSRDACLQALSLSLDSGRRNCGLKSLFDRPSSGTFAEPPTN